VHFFGESFNKRFDGRKNFKERGFRISGFHVADVGGEILRLSLIENRITPWNEVLLQQPRSRKALVRRPRQNHSRIPDFVENVAVFASELHLDAHDFACST
jgi:hypothetical protein